MYFFHVLILKVVIILFWTIITYYIEGIQVHVYVITSSLTHDHHGLKYMNISKNL
jgi:hypothetical protein